MYVLSQDSAQVSNSDAGDDLATMAQEYLATVQLGRKTISDETGEIKTRRSAKHFAELMQAEQPGRYSDAECQAAYDAEKMRLKALERAELQAYKARLRAMLPDDLVRHIRSGLRAEVAALARQGQIAYQVGHYRLRHKIAGEIAAKRGITISPTTKLTKPTRPAKLVQLTLTI